MLEKGLDLIRKLFSAPDRRDGQRYNCPGCDGSGLFDGQRKPWSWNLPSYCSFCEGVGVTPLYGLQGFIVGRTSTLFKTEDLKTPLDSPTEEQLWLGKYPNRKCSFRSFKFSANRPELLLAYSATPLWLIDAAKELATFVAESTYWEDVRNKSLDDVGEATENFEMETQQNGALNPSGLSFVYDEGIPLEPVMKVAELKVGDGPEFNNMERSAHIEDNVSFDSGSQAVPDIVNSTSKLKPKSRYFEKSQLLRQAHEQEAMTVLRKKRVRRRNHIRVKAEKEAALQTMRMDARSAKSSSATPSDELDALCSTFGGWKKLSEIWLEQETAILRQEAALLDKETSIKNVA